MFNRFLFVFAVLSFSAFATAAANSLIGSWHGTLTTAAGSLRLIFNIEEAGDSFAASIVSVDQGGAVIPGLKLVKE